MTDIGVLNSEDILHACQDQGLIIDPFDESHLQPTSYDISVGQFLDDGELRDFDSLRVEHLQSRNFVALERIEFPLNMIGHMNIRSTFRRRGLMGDLGRIEAGWRGRLVIEVFNTKEPIVIDKGERIATIEFVRLAKAVNKGYEGAFQNFGI